MDDLLVALGGQPRRTIEIVRTGPSDRRRAPWHSLRRKAFVDDLGLFHGDDLDATDAEPTTVVLLALAGDGDVLGGVRLHPAPGTDATLGWWCGSRLVVRAGAPRGVGSALVRAACAEATGAGVLRFEATVLDANTALFTGLGWVPVRPVRIAGAAHTLMRWPITRIADLAARTKAELGVLLAEIAPGPVGFTGDDAAPVPGSALVATVDGILPRMVADDPWWAGWCGVLVGAGDIAAMGAAPVGALDALGARDTAHAHRVLAGLRAAADAFGLPLLGGHTQLGVAPSLAVTALGTTPDPVRGGGGRAGHEVRLTADLAGGWRAGYGRAQWDSTSGRGRDELAAMLSTVRRGRPAAAKDVSMAGLVGTLGMLAEASGTGAELTVADVPRPAGVSVGDWFTCFPGTGLLSTDASGSTWPGDHPASSAVCGRLEAAPGVRLRWPDGEVTTALTGPVTGIGPA